MPATCDAAQQFLVPDLMRMLQTEFERLEHENKRLSVELDSVAAAELCCPNLTGPNGPVTEGNWTALSASSSREALGNESQSNRPSDDAGLLLAIDSTQRNKPVQRDASLYSVLSKAPCAPTTPKCDKWLFESNQMGETLRVIPDKNVGCRARLRNMLASQVCDSFIGSVIVMNSICLAAQTELSLPGRSGAPAALEVLENIFLSFYVAEAALNLVARGKECFVDPWFCFDFMLVLSGVSYQWCIRFMTGNSQGGVWQQILVVRTLRLLRLLRALRLVPKLKVVWRLIYGLLTSTGTIFSTLALIILILFMFSCVGMELISKSQNLRSNPELEQLIDAQFSGLFSTMVTLLQFVTVDSVSGIYLPFVKESPVLLLYFLPIILIVSIALMNMVTAVLVEGATSQANNDRDERRRFLTSRIATQLPMYRKLFRKLDNDGTKSVTVRELQALNMNDLPDPLRQTIQNFRLESMGELFELLDGDMSGDIDESEFVDGLLNFNIWEFQNINPETLMTLKITRATSRRTRYMEKDLKVILCGVQKLLSKMGLQPSSCQPNIPSKEDPKYLA